MNRFHHVRIKLESFLNNLSLKKKLRYLKNLDIFIFYVFWFPYF